jgi:hypothetical protein
MRTRSFTIAALLVSMPLGGTAFAHGGHGGHGGHDARGGHGGPGGPPRSGEVHHRSGSFSFELSGAQVPGGGDRAGRAVAGVRLDPEAETVCLRANWRDVAGAVTAIHLHRAPEGQTGPHHIDLLDGEHLAGRANRVEFCVQVGGSGGGDRETHAHAAGNHGAGDDAAPSAPGDRIQEVVDNPGEFYLNVHSTEFPQGALRGQLDG